MSDNQSTSLMSNRMHDVLKFVAQVFLPAVATLYFALAKIWELPASEQVVGSITAIDAFLGVFLGVSTKVYNASGAQYDGAINVSSSEGKKVFSLDLRGEPEELEGMVSATFKINAE